MIFWDGSITVSPCTSYSSSASTPKIANAISQKCFRISRKKRLGLVRAQIWDSIVPASAASAAVDLPVDRRGRVRDLFQLSVYWRRTLSLHQLRGNTNGPQLLPLVGQMLVAFLVNVGTIVQGSGLHVQGYTNFKVWALKKLQQPAKFVFFGFLTRSISRNYWPLLQASLCFADIS